MGCVKNATLEVAENLYPDDYVAQDDFIRRAIDGALTPEETCALQDANLLPFEPVHA